MDSVPPNNSVISLKFVRERWNALDPFQKGACVVAGSILLAAAVFSGDYSFDVGGLLGGVLAVYVGVMVAERQIAEARRQIEDERRESARYAALMLFDPLIMIHSTIRLSLEAGVNSLSIEILHSHGWCRESVQKFLNKIAIGVGPAMRQGFDDIEAQYPDLFRDDLISKLPLSLFSTYRNRLNSLKINCAWINRNFDSSGVPMPGEVAREHLSIFALQAYNSSLMLLKLIEPLVRPSRSMGLYTSNTFDRALDFARKIQSRSKISQADAEQYLMEVSGLAAASGG